MVIFFGIKMLGKRFPISNQGIYEIKIDFAIPEWRHWDPGNGFLRKVQPWNLGQRFVTGKDAFSAGVEDIGEAVPVLPDGSCADPDLYNTGNGFCTVPGRYDIGRHFFLTGGLSGSKETYEKLLSSIWSFYQVLPKSFIDTNPMMQKMFKKPEYLKAMDTLCGTSGNDFYFRPLQVDLLFLIKVINYNLLLASERE